MAEFSGMGSQAYCGTAEQQEIKSTAWEGHITTFYGILKQAVISRSVYSDGLASMRGKEAWEFS